MPGGKALGLWIARRREDLGFGQEEFAATLGWSVETQRRIERGRRGLRHDGEVILMARHLQVTEADLQRVGSIEGDWTDLLEAEAAHKTERSLEDYERGRRKSAEDLIATIRQRIAEGEAYLAELRRMLEIALHERDLTAGSTSPDAGSGGPADLAEAEESLEELAGVGEETHRPRRARGKRAGGGRP